MKIPSHLDKYERLNALRERFDPLADFELWFWTTLTASTNALNTCLHLAGLTSDDPVFSTIPGVHMVQQPDGTYARMLRGPGDVSHVGWPPIEGNIPSDIRALEDALETIEQYRDPCIRGGLPPTEAIVTECNEAFGEIRSILKDRRKGSRP